MFLRRSCRRSPLATSGLIILAAAGALRAQTAPSAEDSVPQKDKEILVYRWRPHGRDVGSCVMEVMILKRLDRGQPRPKPVSVHWLRDDEPWSDAKEIPILGPVIDQDMSNMPYVQEGLVASATGRVQLGTYQESRIRHFHQTLDTYLQR